MSALSLRDALDLTGLLIDRRSSIPILCCASVVAAKKAVTIEATDLDIRISVDVDSELPDCAVAANHGALAAAVRGIPTATLAVDKKRGLTVNGGGVAVTIDGLDHSEWPKITAPEAGHKFELSARELEADLEAVRPAICHEETRYYLNGILMHAVDDRLHLVATDGHRLHRASRPAPIR